MSDDSTSTIAVMDNEMISESIPNNALKLLKASLNSIPVQRESNTKLVCFNDGISSDWLNDAKSQIQKNSDDIVITINLGDLLADKIGMGRGILKALLKHPSCSFISDLRKRINSDKRKRWLFQNTGISEEGSKRIARMLSFGDFQASKMLFSKTNVTIDAYTRSPNPITDRDIFELLDHHFRHSLQNTWVILSELEQLVTGSSSASPGLRKGLKHLLSLQNKWHSTALIFGCWYGAASRLDVIDYALKLNTVNLEPVNTYLEHDPPKIPFRPDIIVESLKRIFKVKLSYRADLKTWIGFNEEHNGGIAFCWPHEELFPSGKVVITASRCIEIYVGANIALLTPTWAFGADERLNRGSLLNTSPQLALIPLNEAQQSALFWRGPEDHPNTIHLDTLKQSVYEVWSR